jgi:hypothetical protein
MSRDKIDLDHMDITGARPRPHTSSLTVSDEVIIVVNEAYGPDGDNLVGISDVEFDGFPAVTLLVRVGDRDEQVHLSPVHGDRRKKGMEDLADGTKCQLLCPVSKKPLPKVGHIDDGPAEYCVVYLTKKLEAGSMIYVSDVWGHHHSRIVDNFELISAWSGGADED